ncbi:glucose/galactose transporter GluP [Methyloglobulus morosus KoM1]|uniref:Glucose/galactose transporter GluP n=1 Tax=Methyloglobulus morosus KoM1 TaxID=1116472 RepID=V5BFS9_9GAMM|nr:sugar MFS transporter [Methyloglobulus morosus]ESS72135.1 glucose/galactose transporter GluP [Methyloglobulus morosus KoM1]
MNNPQHLPIHPVHSSNFGALALLTSLFFIWGFITCLNDILIPHLKAVFTLNYAQAMLIQSCFFAAYFLVSVPSGYLVDKIGYKRGIVTGLAIAGTGCLLFYPAAALRLYPLFLSAVFVLAVGITLLQVAANPYMTLLGKPETASSRLTLTQAFNSLGTTLAPYFGAFFILATSVKTPDEMKLLSIDALSKYQALEATAVQHPYLLLAAMLFAVSGIFAFVKLPVVKGQEVHGEVLEDQYPGKPKPSAWHYSRLVLGAIGIFVYVGAEVSIGSFLVSFLSDPAITGLTPSIAAKYVSFYWGGAMVGRFIGAVVMQKVQPGKVLTFNAVTAGLLVVTTIFSTGSVAMSTILAVGFFNSIMFPTIFALALKGLGKHTGQGSGILCSAIVGGAILPVIQGLFADRFGLHLAFIIPVFCYAYIAYFGWRDWAFHSYPHA